MSQRITLTISDELAELIDQKRGLRSAQAFFTEALLNACTGSAVEAELRRQIEQLHETLRQLGGGVPTSAPQPAEPAPASPGRPEPMGW